MTVDRQLTNVFDGEAFDRTSPPHNPVWQSVHPMIDGRLVALDTRGRMFYRERGEWVALPPPPEK